MSRISSTTERTLKSEEALTWLRKAYEEPVNSEAPIQGLNIRFRRSLRQHAAAAKLQYQQDNAGNIFVTRVGREPDVPGIALGFPIDGALSPYQFVSAFRLFYSLAAQDLLTDLVLLGWTVADGKVIGREIWQSSAKLNQWQVAAGQKTGMVSASSSELEEFRGLSDCGDFPLSAIVEVKELTVDKLRLSGSPVLTAKARQHCQQGAKDIPSTVRTPRAPYLLAEGASAEEVAHAVICEYSDYVGALFDNFD